jgi:voltage-gated potassium channel
MSRTTKYNFSYLLVALSVFLFGVPIIVDLDIVSNALIRAIAFSSLLAIGIWSLNSSRRTFSVALALAICGIILSLWTSYSHSPILLYSSIVAILAFLILATGVAAKQIAIDDVISTNRIVGAICVYLMLGVIWALMYSLLEGVVPDSFRGLSEYSGNEWGPDWVYFSFVTLATLGYGEITPVTSSARALAYFEAIVGQFYMAILVAGLVSSYITAKRS